MAEADVLEAYKSTRLMDTLKMTNEHLIQFKNLIAGRQTFENFIYELNTYGVGKQCRVVWEENTVAFRCFSCSLSPFTAICVDCFLNGNHEGHDMRIFMNTKAGGMCDCGNNDTMKSTGFCASSSSSWRDPPPELLYPAKFLIPPFVAKTVRLMYLITTNYKDAKQSYNKMIDLLQDLAELNHHLKAIICETLSNPDYKAQYIRDVDVPLPQADINYFREYKTVVIQHTDLYPSFTRRENFFQGLSNNNLLDFFFTYYIFKVSGSRLLEWFLALMSYQPFKAAIGATFAKNYVELAEMIIKRMMIEDKHASGILENFIMQILTTTSISVSLINQSALLHLMLSFNHFFLKFYYCDISIASDVHIDLQKSQRTPSVHTYRNFTWHLNVFFNDLNVSLNFINDIAYMKLFLKMAKYFQFANKCVREVGLIIAKPFEPYEVFNAQVEYSVLPLWTLVKHWNNSCIDNIERFFHLSLNALKNDMISRPLENNTVSFNLPLHRILALVIATIYRKDLNFESLVKFNSTFLKHAMQAPSRLLAAHREMCMRIWTDDQDIMEQCGLYKTPEFVAFSMDLDFFFLQFVSSQLESNIFVQFILENFNILDALNPMSSRYETNQQRLYMIEETLLFFSALFSARVLSSKTDESEILNEITALMSIRDCHFTEVVKNIPDRGWTYQNERMLAVEEKIADVAHLKPVFFDEFYNPRRGYFSIKNDVFSKKYDPIISSMRALNVYERMAAFDQFLDSQEDFVNDVSILWPPFRLSAPEKNPRLKSYTDFLHSPSLHAFLYVILYGCYEKNLSPNIMFLAINLLTLSLSEPYHKKEDAEDATLTTLYEHCLIPLDQQYNILAPNGLVTIFRFIQSNIPREDNDTQRDELGYSSTLINENLTPFENAEEPEERENRKNYTILTLLIKLYEEHTGGVYMPAVPEEQIRFKGGADFCIGSLLDKLYAHNDAIRNSINEYPYRERSEDSTEDLEQEPLENQEIQIHRRREYLGEDEDGPEFGPDNLYKSCSFCNTVEPRKHLLHQVLITPTNIMGYQTSDDHPVMEFILQNTFAYNYDILSSMLKNFNTNLTSWYNSIWVQTCGHQIHQDCLYNQYDRDQSKMPYEYFCGTCNQLCNFIIPIYTFVSDADNLNHGPNYSTLYHLFHDRTHEVYSRGFQKLSEDFRFFFPNEQVRFYTFASVMRNNIELFLMNSSLDFECRDSHFVKTRKYLLGPLFQFINKLCRNESWADMNDLLILLDMHSVDPYLLESKGHYNIAMIDCKQIMVYCTLFLSSFDPGLVKSIILYITNIFVLQLLSWVVASNARQTTDDFVEWETLTGTQTGNLMLNMMEEFGGIVHAPSKSDMRFTITDKMTEFMKFAVTLYYAILFPYDEKIHEVPKMNLENLYNFLMGRLVYEEDHISYIQCYDWDDDLYSNCVAKFRFHVPFSLKRSPDLSLFPRMFITMWKRPGLIPLPENHYEFITYFHQLQSGDMKASYKNKKYFCLICSTCCYLDPENEQEAIHFNSCCSKTGMYLRYDKNVVYAFWHERSKLYESPYVDIHYGTNVAARETHIMSRDSLQFLRLELMWLTNSFDVVKDEKNFWMDYQSYIT